MSRYERIGMNILSGLPTWACCVFCVRGRRRKINGITRLSACICFLISMQHVDTEAALLAIQCESMREERAELFSLLAIKLKARTLVRTGESLLTSSTPGFDEFRLHMFREGERERKSVNIIRRCHEPTRLSPG